ncbi:MAG: MucR family transcriptional regulator [Alphaproteobacteria bacterium]
MSTQEESQPKNAETLRMAVDIVSAYVGNNSVPASQVPEVINTVYASLASIDGSTSSAENHTQKPAIPVRRSITPDYIVCLEDGKKLKMLKRHLRAVYGLSPEEYRAKWNLPADYPMVAPNYAKQRSNFAKQIGLGRKKGEKVGSRRNAD